MQPHQIARFAEFFETGFDALWGSAVRARRRCSSMRPTSSQTALHGLRELSQLSVACLIGNPFGPR